VFRLIEPLAELGRDRDVGAYTRRLGLGPGDDLGFDPQRVASRFQEQNGGAVVVLQQPLQAMEDLVENVLGPGLGEDLGVDLLPYRLGPLALAVAEVLAQQHGGVLAMTDLLP